MKKIYLYITIILLSSCQLKDETKVPVLDSTMIKIHLSSNIELAIESKDDEKIFSTNVNGQKEGLSIKIKNGRLIYKRIYRDNEKLLEKMYYYNNNTLDSIVLYHTVNKESHFEYRRKLTLTSNKNTPWLTINSELFSCEPKTTIEIYPKRAHAIEIFATDSLLQENPVEFAIDNKIERIRFRGNKKFFLTYDITQGVNFMDFYIYVINNVIIDNDTETIDGQAFPISLIFYKIDCNSPMLKYWKKIDKEFIQF